MKFDVDKLSSKLHKIDKELQDIERNECIKKYGTFLDSKQEVIQLYLLFMFFGVNMNTIQQFPSKPPHEPPLDPLLDPSLDLPQEYDVD